ncbi:MAG TPA: response regulator transcription factor [Tepidisphaeraceae bacterium]|nr:response regulator transcription factor [Tepidisphaeraceae bacterium]
MTKPETETPAETPEQIRILLVDDHPVVRQGLRQLIEAEPDLVVLAEAATAREAVELAEQNPPDVALIDLALTDRSGLELIKDLRNRISGLPMLVLSMHDESLYAERALRAGARGYVMKHEATETLLAAIRKVKGGEIAVSPKMAARMLSQMVTGNVTEVKTPVSRLTDRELEVFTLIGQGVSTRQIAERLFVSVKTVEAHRENIKQKLSLKTGTELNRYAMQYAIDQVKPTGEPTA